MGRSRRKGAPRPHDQGDWDVCIAWRRMYVACQNVGWNLRVPIANFLQDNRNLIDKVTCHQKTRTKALGRLREAWASLAAGNEWEACVAGITARAIIVEDESPDMHTVQSLVPCGAIREAFPLAPPGFEKIGRSATKADPGSLIVGTAPLTDSKEEGTDE